MPQFRATARRSRLRVSEPIPPTRCCSRDSDSKGQRARHSFAGVFLFDLCPLTFALSYKPNNSRRRLVWDRETGISVCFLSSMRSWYEDLNQGTTSLMRLML